MSTASIPLRDDAVGTLRRIDPARTGVLLRCRDPFGTAAVMSTLRPVRLARRPDGARVQPVDAEVASTHR